MKTLILLLVLLFPLFTLSANDKGAYFYSETLTGEFNEITSSLKEALKAEGFGVVTEIDMAKTLSEKLEDVEMPSYLILGVCNPGYAYKSIQAEPQIGLLLPCKIIIRDVGDGKTEVAAVNPSMLMSMVGNKELEGVAEEVTASFRAVLAALEAEFK